MKIAVPPESLPTTPMGGTELMLERWKRLIDPELQERVELCLTRLPLTPPVVGRPRVMWMHNSPWDTAQGLEWIRIPRVLDTIALWVFISEWQKEVFLRQFPTLRERKSVVISNCIPAITAEHSPPFIDGKVRLIYTSAFQRGLKELLSIFARLPGRFELTVVGSPHTYGKEYANIVHTQIPQEAAYLNELYAILEMHPRIRWYPYLPQTDVVQELLKSDVWVHPGYWHETFCLAMVEALAAGCDVVIGQGRVPSALGEISKGFASVAWTDAHLEDILRGYNPDTGVAAWHSNPWAPASKGLRRSIFAAAFGERSFKREWERNLKEVLA